ncbi:hypothetical protein CHUAL_006745 [Chamberlinius hualienensis]
MEIQKQKAADDIHPVKKLKFEKNVNPKWQPNMKCAWIEKMNAFLREAANAILNDNARYFKTKRRGDYFVYKDDSKYYYRIYSLDKQFFKSIFKSSLSLYACYPDFQYSNILCHVATERSLDPSMLNFLLDTGYDIMHQIFHGLTVIHIVIIEQKVEALKIILQRLADKSLQKFCTEALEPWELDKESVYLQQLTALKLKWFCEEKNIFTFAFTYCSLNIVRLLWPLLAEEDKIYYCNKSNVYTPTCFVHSAILHQPDQDPVEVIKFLVDQGCDVNQCVLPHNHFINRFNRCDEHGNFSLPINGHSYLNSKFNYSILDCAIFANNYDLVSFLIANGAEVNPISCDIVHPLYISCLLKLTNISKLLISHGGNPNYLFDGGDGMRPVVLSSACLYDNCSLLNLIKAGGDLKLLPDEFWEYLQHHMDFKRNFIAIKRLRNVFTGHALNIPFNSITNEQYENGKLSPLNPFFDFDGYKFLFHRRNNWLSETDYSFDDQSSIFNSTINSFICKSLFNIYNHN